MLGGMRSGGRDVEGVSSLPPTLGRLLDSSCTQIIPLQLHTKHHKNINFITLFMYYVKPKPHGNHSKPMVPINFPRCTLE